MPQVCITEGQAYLESQVAQDTRPPYPEVDHNRLKVAHDYRPLAFQASSCCSGLSWRCARLAPRYPMQCLGDSYCNALFRDLDAAYPGLYSMPFGGSPTLPKQSLLVKIPYLKPSSLQEGLQPPDNPDIQSFDHDSRVD